MKSSFLLILLLFGSVANADIALTKDQQISPQMDILIEYSVSGKSCPELGGSSCISFTDREKNETFGLRAPFSPNLLIPGIWSNNGRYLVLVEPTPYPGAGGAYDRYMMIDMHQKKYVDIKPTPKLGGRLSMPGKFSPDSKLHAGHWATDEFGYKGWRFVLRVSNLETELPESQVIFHRDYANEDVAYYDWISNQHLMIQTSKKFAADPQIEIFDVKQNAITCTLPVNTYRIYPVTALPELGGFVYANNDLSYTFYNTECKPLRNIRFDQLPKYVSKKGVSNTNRYMFYYDVNYTNPNSLFLLDLNDGTYKQLDFSGKILAVKWSKDDSQLLVTLFNVNDREVWVEAWNTHSELAQSKVIPSSHFARGFDFGFSDRDGQFYLIDPVSSETRIVMVFQKE